MLQQERGETAVEAVKQIMSWKLGWDPLTNAFPLQAMVLPPPHQEKANSSKRSMQL